jgi:divalent metal cation (Fe/Co/Zn/Cd) transporter
MTLATVSWSLKPPSERFPGGYGKIESLGSLGVSGILLGGGFMMGWAAVIALCQQFFPDFAELAASWGLLPHSHGHHHGADALGPNINAAWLAAGSILIKEWLYRASMAP